MRLLFVTLALSTLAACASTTPNWDQQFGSNARIALARQIIDPGAGRNTDPVAGMDGRAANAGYERYQRAFSGTTPQAPTFIINSGAK
jgi:hypothetical protein